jgi:hypothetical protein
MRLAISLPLLLLAATPALAYSVERITYVATDGSPYFWDATPRGRVFVAPESDPSDQFFLTTDCVVENFKHGTGSWGVDDAGWQISFNNRYHINFPGTMPPLDATNCMMLR